MHPVPTFFEVAFLLLQAFVVAFLLLHDWISLGSLNNLQSVRHLDTLSHRVFVTLLPLIPAAIGLIYCAKHFGHAYPGWLNMYLGITYVVMLAGLLRAWWVPYLVVPDPERAARYKVLFAGTHTFLPERNGISPNTLHSLFHLSIVAILVLLFFRERI
jgi:hypothetical protein